MDPEGGSGQPLENNRLDESINSTHTNISTSSETSDASSHSRLDNVRGVITGNWFEAQRENVADAISLYFIC